MKFIAAYIIFGVLGFSVVAILSSRLTYRYLVQERANSLYSEATLIATTYSETKDTSLSEAVVTEQMNAVSTFLDADIWIVDRSGVILSDSGKEGYKGQQIEAFDTTRTGTRYEVGTYHDMFQSEVLTVMAPVTRDYVTNGYVIIHNSIDNILSSQYEILHIVYITALIIFILSLFILSWCFSLGISAQNTHTSWAAPELSARMYQMKCADLVSRLNVFQAPPDLKQLQQ